MSRAFRFLVGTREKLYRAGVFPTYRLQHPVVSVGNLTVGGTGKTPLVIALAERLRDAGFRPVVLSRGYKRRSAGIVVVSRGAGPVVDWTEAGDEPFLIARRVPGIAVVVGADRYQAGSLAERENLGNLFILDDGFQHRRLFRHADIVTVDPAEWAAGERLLPSGRWREPKSAILRAHAACVQDNPGTPAPDLPIPSFRVQTVVDGLYRDSEPVAIETVRGRAVTAFAGIAKPERFFDAVENLGITPRRRVRFGDHHVYTRRELDRIGGEIQITTEKDAVRLQQPGSAGFVHLRISVKIPELDRLIELIRSRLAEPACGRP